MEKSNVYSLLNFGATMWVIYGIVMMLTAYYSNVPINYPFSYCCAIVVLTVKMLLIFASDEIFSFHHLVK